MSNILTQLELGELSLVDNPANPLAKAPLYKRHSEGDNMTEITKEDMDKAKAENERLRKFLIDNEYVIKADSIEKKAPMEQIEVEGEMVNKADIPAPVLKALEAADFAKRDAELTKMADEKLPHFEQSVAKELLKFDLDDKVLAALMAADAAFEAAMTEAGDTTTKSDLKSAEETLNEMAKAAKPEHGTFEKAYAAILDTDEGKALYKAMKEEK